LRARDSGAVAAEERRRAGVADLGLVWLAFVFCAALIGFSGPELSRSGDIIAEKTGLSHSWIGLILLATVTSLPELVTGLSAVTIADVPDIAVGDVFGSCVFNLAILIVLDLLHRDEPIYRRAHQGHILAAGFGIVLVGWAGMSVLLSGQNISFNVGHVGLYSPIMIGLYFIAIRTVFVYERNQREEFVEDVAAQYADITLRTAVRRYLVAAVVLVAAGIWLPFVGSDLANAMGWNNTFVGTLFVAAATSLPELVVTIAALRLGALDMAIANLLGSNLFDMLVLAIDDFAFLKGPILSHVSPMHAVSAFSAVIMTGIVVVGLLYRSKTRVFRYVDWISISLFLVYLLNSYVLYVYGN
jgi:cation:H+ antiporter